MQVTNDLSRSRRVFEQDSTLIAVIELSLSNWLVAGLVPGLDRHPLKKLGADQDALLQLIERWRDEAVKTGRTITRIVVAFEAGRDGFWLARWLKARGIEAFVIHSTSIAVPREHRLRAILLERGFVAPQGKRKLEQFLSVLMDEQNGAGLSPRMVLLVEDARAQWVELDRRITAFDTEFVRWAKENEQARRLTTIPGFGAIVASAFVAAVGRAESFDRGRDLAAWLGLVPRQFTTGGKPKLLGISKRGNKYLRKQLIHGARAALPHIAERDTPLGRWAKELMSRTHRNIVVVALANKLTRIAWAVLQRGKPFDAKAVSVAA